MSLLKENISPNLHPKTKLWRYMSLDKLINLLDTETLFMATPSSYKDSDPYEGLFPKKFLDGIRLFMESQYNTLYSEFQDPAYKNHLESMRQSYNIKAERFFFNSMASHSVNCWHQNEYESEAMWKLYSDEKKGVAIETTVESLSESIIDDNFSRVSFHEVKYIDFHDVNLKNNNILVNGQMAPLLKRHTYRHENEARLVYFPESLNTHLPDFRAKPYHLKIDTKKLIHRIHISPYASPPFPQSVNCIAKLFNIKSEKITISKLLTENEELKKFY